MQQTITRKKITKEGALAELCKRSLYRFLLEFIEEIEPAANDYVWNWHIKFLCNRLQELVFLVKDKKPTHHLNVNICPGATKSTIFSRVATAWIWTVMPEATVINVSRDSNNVKEFALKCREIIESKKYKLLFPEVEIKSEPDAMLFFENTKNGKRYGLTTTSKGSTGKHADFIIFDDIYSYVDLDSPATVKTLQNSIEGYLSRFKNKERGVLINVMQRLGVDDPSAFLFFGNKQKKLKPKLSNFENICLPAKLNKLVHPPSLKDRYKNNLLDPIRLSDKILRQEKIKYGYKYHPQYMQVAKVDKDGLMYPKLNFFNHELPDGPNYSFTDVADTGDDYLCTWFVKIAANGIYVYDAIYTKSGSKVTIPLMEQKMNLYKCVLNWIESNNQGSVFISQLSGKVANIDGKFESSHKESRIFAYSHLVRHIYFKKTGSHEYLEAIEHLEQLPKKLINNGRGMDVDSADALTAMLRYLFYNFKHYFIIK